MKKKIIIPIIIAIVIILIIILIIALVKNSSGSHQNINEVYDVSKGMEYISQNTRLSDYQDPEFEGKLDTEGNFNIDFSDLEGAKYRQLGEVNDETLTGVWIVKLGNTNQKNKVEKRIKNKIDELKTRFSSNAKLKHVLEDTDNLIIKEKEGIIIAVIAPDAYAIASGVEASINSQNIEAMEISL